MTFELLALSVQDNFHYYAIQESLINNHGVKKNFSLILESDFLQYDESIPSGFSMKSLRKLLFKSLGGVE